MCIADDLDTKEPIKLITFLNICNFFFTNQISFFLP